MYFHPKICTSILTHCCKVQKLWQKAWSPWDFHELPQTGTDPDDRMCSLSLHWPNTRVHTQSHMWEAPLWKCSTWAIDGEGGGGLLGVKIRLDASAVYSVGFCFPRRLSNAAASEQMLPVNDQRSHFCCSSNTTAWQPELEAQSTYWYIFYMFGIIHIKLNVVIL